MAGTIKLIIKKSLQDNILLYLFIPAVFLLGFMIGAMGVNKLDATQIKDLVDFVDGFINNLPTASVDASLETKHAVISNLKTLFYIWFLGLTVIGIPLTLVIIFSRGFILGFTTGFLVQQKSFQGVLVILMTILPQNLLFIPVVLIAAVSSISFSLFVVRGKFAGKTINLSKRLIGYTFSFLVLGLFAVLSALIQGYVSPSLVKAVFYFT